MSIVPVSIPRWQWRIAAADLSWLFKRLPVPLGGPGRRVEETYLICARSAHSAVLRGNRLEVRWRKQTAPEGFELWDTILDVEAPFHAAELERLWAAWGLPRPALRDEYPDARSLLDDAVLPGVVTAVAVTRFCREASCEGINCSVETLEVAQSVRLESFAIEHEDPSLMAQLLATLGLKPSLNVNIVQSLKAALDMPQNEGFEKWETRSNESTS